MILVPKIAVITAVYNAADTLEATIKSVLSQTTHRQNYEFWIIDGLSTDGSQDIIKLYEEHIDGHIIEKDLGIYDAWNKGIQNTKAEWICFLGADDALYHNSIEVLLKYLEQNSYSFDYISSKSQLTDMSGNNIETFGSKWEWSRFFIYMNVAHVASLHNRSLFNTYGLFSTFYKTAGDYEFLLRVGSNLKAGFLDEITAKVRIGGASHKLVALKEQFKIDRYVKNRSTPSSVAILVTSVIKYYVKLSLNYLGIYFRLRNN